MWVRNAVRLCIPCMPGPEMRIPLGAWNDTFDRTSSCGWKSGAGITFSSGVGYPSAEKVQKDQ